MKQLLLILFLILSVTLKSQTTINIPAPVAKNIAKELVGCDSAKAILKLTEEQLLLTEQKVTLKDSIISGYVQKDFLYEERIKNEQAKFDIQKNQIDDLKKQNRKLKI